MDSTIAGLLCAAIVSDTLMFRSPTCTALDEKTAKKLAEKANIDLEEMAKEMFNAGSSLKGKTAEEICFQDFKQFTVDDITFGVGQINSMNKEELQDIKEQLIPFLPKVLTMKGVEMVYFMLTDILEETSELLCYGTGARSYINEAYDLPKGIKEIVLKGVMSRKKQLIPALVGVMQQ